MKKQVQWDIAIAKLKTRVLRKAQKITFTSNGKSISPFFEMPRG